MELIMLSLLSPFDVQLELSQFVKEIRKNKGFSVKSFSKKTGVPDSTIRKFEKTGEISLRQFLMIYGDIGKLADIQQLTKKSDVPNSLDEVIKNA
ncbi:MAG: transcriptional regulator with XRE-family HTH domain [Paraglaciecola sp.]|jgi:transcriptional regulator with XRE-family HTH domain